MSTFIFEVHFFAKTSASELLSKMLHTRLLLLLNFVLLGIVT